MNTSPNVTALRQTLSMVAPESEGVELDPNAAIRDQLDLDSVDFLNFVVKIHEDFGVTVPESDYQHLLTLNSAVKYLTARLIPTP